MTSKSRRGIGATKMEEAQSERATQAEENNLSSTYLGK